MKTEFSIAKQIRAARERQGWTQDKLAIEAEVTSRTIVNIEAGKGLNLGTLAKIANALGCPVAELLDATE